MANYLSKFTGEQIDENIALLKDNKLNVVNGLVKRDLITGLFSTVTKEDILNFGIPELDEQGKIPTSQLPSFVDDVVEGYYYNNNFYKEPEHITLIPAETGKIYIDIENSLTYRWSGSLYVKIASALALGETEATAYRGDRGKIAYDFATNANAAPVADVGVKYNSSAKTSSTDMTSSEIENFLNNVQRGAGFLDIGQKNADFIVKDLTRTLTLAEGWMGDVKYDIINELVIVYFNIRYNNIISSNTRIDGVPLSSSCCPSTEEREYARSISDVQFSVDSNGRIFLLVNGTTVPAGLSIKGEVAYFI